MNACTLLVSALLALAAVAQTGPQVTGSGEKKVEVMPTTMRVIVGLQSEGDTLDAALADIQKKAEELTKKLAELKPAEGTLVTQGPYTGAAGGAEERMRRMMDRRRFGEEEQGKGKGKVTLTTTVRAEWPVAPGDMVAMLREEDRIRQAVQKAVPEQVAGAKVDEEARDEMAMMMEQAYGGEAMPGRPQFLFVAKLPEDLLAKARHEAFLKAKQDAQAISEAAGATLGPLKTVESHAGSGDQEHPEWRYAMRMMGMAEPQGEREAVSPGLRPLTFVVAVSATFELTTAK
jgi:uncharacterized protein YggE